MTTAPYGSWRSPITADLLVEQVVGLSQVRTTPEAVYWNESRPAEGGRQVVVRRTPDGEVRDAIPEGFSARTRVHEYGGQSYAVQGGVLYFSNFTDQRVYRVTHEAPPEAITAEAVPPASVRFADFEPSPDGRWLACVRERHLDGEVVNELVVLSTDASSEPVVIADGHDFFAAPRFSPDGSSLCWICWDHPNMPWDGNDLWVATFADGRMLGGSRHVAGGPTESISQPRWSPGGVLHYASDRTGWWNLYAEGRSGGPLVSMEAEFSGPDWAFGQSTYVFLEDGRLVAAWSSRGESRMGVITDGSIDAVEQPYTSLVSLQPEGTSVVAVAGSPTQGPAVVRFEVPSGEVSVLKRSRAAALDPSYVSVPRPIEFPTEDGLTAHALYYPPHNPQFSGPEDERPPLVVMSHGGPTGATTSVLNPLVQYWTTRGLAVVDVNYGGSAGYGRAYRQRLQGRWGIVDVDDCVNAAKWLASEGLVDPERMVIRGGSAGGYTTLAALTFRDVFAAGASHFGVADAEALATDTHKFESRYLDGLIGPYPQARDVYVERSPIHHTDRLDRPMILFQGLEDLVVPPDQAEMMAGALREKGIPFAHLAFEGEQHGFRKAETIKRVAEAELSFYGRVLGFGPADEIEPVQIENEEALRR